MKIAVIYRELFLLLLTIAHCRNSPTNNHNDKFYWYDKNKSILENRMRSMNMENLPRVKNVIIFIGDGMGMTTITAARTLKRQVTQNPNAQMIFDDFPATALMQTDIINSQIPESAASSTALFCGVKTNFESLGVDSTSMGRDACKNINSHAPSIIGWAQKKNLKTGFVTTSRITHATPAALYAHSRRHIEDDSKVDSFGCKDIARQLIENEIGKNINVIMGGGMRSFIPETSEGGRRKDGKNLTATWMNSHLNGEFITTRNELLNVSENTEHLLGIFAKSHMQFNVDRNKEIEPSLAEMTQAAIKILTKNNTRGFLLIVEAGKIDLAHHYNNAFRALDDTLQLDESIDAALKMIDLANSLVIVTSDHASAMSYSGFATPKNLTVLGMDKYVSNVDGKPYQLLTYSSGLGYQNYNETAAIHDYRNSYHKATIASTWANHAADDVPVYAIGQMANLLFSGTFDQTYIAHVVAYAMCIFQYESRCHNSVYIKRKPVYENGPRGIEALKQELGKLSQNKPFGAGNNLENIKEALKHTSVLSLNEELNDVMSKNGTSQEEIYESLDLVSNSTTLINSSRTFRQNNCFVIVVVLFAFY
ncbi:alkaline phosphatase-like [Chironomus tepperi]|uniref:alkaline phosphatase-like n=1 Tax=Chironomus tepperi TaxID=113505 RepID=UPI00391F317F